MENLTKDKNIYSGFNPTKQHVKKNHFQEFCQILMDHRVWIECHINQNFPDQDIENI